MKKQILALCVTMSALFGMCVPISAVSENTMQPIDKRENVALEEIYNEYDYIVSARNAIGNDENIASVCAEEIDYINSDAIESELLYRASLPTDVLKNYYCYTDEAIAILRVYNGERLEENPALRRVTATLTGSFDEPFFKSNNRIGALYNWRWNYCPLICWTDYVAMSWEGTYENGRTNNMAFDQSASFAVVDYYFTSEDNVPDSFEERYRYTQEDFISDNLYHGAAIKFPVAKSTDEGRSCWAKKGSLFFYIDLVNQKNGPKLYELSVHGEYAHYTAQIGAGVSFPAAISISFSGKKDILGVDNQRIAP